MAHYRTTQRGPSLAAKVAALLISFVMAFTMMPAAAFAEQDGSSSTLAAPVAPDATTVTYSQADGYEPYHGWQTVADRGATSGGGTSNVSGYVNWELIDPISDGVTSSDGTTWSTYSGDVNVITDTNATDADADVPYYKNIIVDPVALDSDGDGDVDGDDSVDFTFLMTATGGRLMDQSSMYKNYDASAGTGGVVVSTSDDPADWSNADDIVWTGASSNTSVTANSAGWNWARMATFSVSSTALQAAGDKPLYLVLENGVYCGNATLRGNIVFQISTGDQASWSGSLSAAGGEFSQGQGTIVFRTDSASVVRDLTSPDAWVNRVVDPVVADDNGNVSMSFNATGSGGNWISLSRWQQFARGNSSGNAAIDVYDENPADNASATAVESASITMSQTDSSSAAAGVTFSISGLEEGHTYYLEIPSTFGVMSSSWSLIGRPIVYEFTVGYKTVNKDALSTAISQATALASSVAVSADGNNVSSGNYWATQAAVDALNAAVTSAQAVYDNDAATETQISDAIKSLETASNTFKAARAHGNVNPAALEAAIAEAQSLYDSMIVSTDGADVSVNDVWYTQDEKDALETAITTAKAALDVESPTVESYNAAIAALEQAVDTANAAAKQGLRNNVVSSWNIGAETNTDVVASLYEDGILRITGSGDCASYKSYSSVPWYSSRTSIKGYEFSDDAVAPTNMDYWFYGCTKLTNAGNIPASVTSLKNTFYGCTSLVTAPALSAAATNLEGTFSHCTALTSAPEIPASATSMKSMFANCSALVTAPAIPESVTDVTYAFQNCSKLKAAPALPAGATSLAYTFQNCTSLTEAPVIPAAVTNLSYTFQGCTALTTAPEIPDGVTNMTSTFQNCSALTAAPDIPATVTALAYTFQNCTALTEAPTIEPGVTTMNSTFYGCTSLAEAPVIPEGVVNLTSTFQNCTALTAAPAIPSTVTNMTATFSGCTALAKAPVIPEGVTTMNQTFMNCTSLAASPAIPSTVTTMTSTFYGCSALSDAGAISEGVTSMNQAFDYCTSLVEAPELPSTVTSMNATFANCSNLTTVKTLPASLKDMTSTFLNCTSLTSVPAVPDTVTSLQMTFQNCTSLVDSPEISDSAAITNMSYAFYGCTSLEKIPTIPSSVSNMSYTFSGCTSLKEMSLLPSSVKNRMYTFMSDNALNVLPEGLVIPKPQYSTYGTGTFAAASPYNSSNLLKTYITGPADASVTSYDWASSNRELVVVSAGIDASSVADLTSALEKANAQLAAVVASADGSDVANGAQWVSQDAYDLLSSTIEHAQAVYDDVTGESSTDSQSDVDNAIFQLKSATLQVSSLAQSAQTDSAALQSAIEAAQTDRAGVAISADGSDVPATSQYVTSDTADAFDAAIAAAQAVLDDSTASQSQTDSALATLESAQAAFDAAKQAGTVTVYAQSDGFEPYTGWQDAQWVAAEDPYYANSPSGTDRKGFPAWSLTSPLSVGTAAYDKTAGSYTTGDAVTVVTDTNATKTEGTPSYANPYYYKNVILNSYDPTVDNSFQLSCVAAGGAAQTVDGSGGQGWRNCALYSTDGNGNPIGGIAITTSDDPADWSKADNVVWTGSGSNTTVDAHFAGADNWLFNVHLNVPANTLQPNTTYYLVLKDGLTGGWTHLWANVVFEFHTNSAGVWSGDLTQAGYGREQGNGATKLGIMDPAPSTVTTDLTNVANAWNNTITDGVELADGTATFRVHADGSGSNWQTLSSITSQASKINVYDSLDEGATPVCSYSAKTLSIALANTERDAPSVDGFDITASGLETGKTYYLVFDSAFTPSTTGGLNKDVTFEFTTKDDAPSVANADVTFSPAEATYTGSAIEPGVTVTMGDTTLSAGTDYTVTYAVDGSVAGNTASLSADGLPLGIGSYVATITGMGGYDGSTTQEFTVLPISVAGADIAVTPTESTFTGSAIKPAVTVTLGGATLTQGTDYTVSYADNVNVGTATVTIAGAGIYGGTSSATFDIAKANVANATVSLTPASTAYTGVAIEPLVAATLGDYALVAGTDYTVAYLDNVSPGTGKALIVGRGNFEGLAIASFQITGVDISSAAVSVDDATYTGSAVEPAVTVALGDKTLVEGRDYTVSYANNVDAGTATATITGAGVYSGQASGTFSIAQADISSATVSVANAVYTGSAVEPAVTVTLGDKTLVEGRDYTVSYADNTEVGNGTATITGIGNYTGSASGTFSVATGDLAHATIAPIADQSYTGDAIEPAVTVTYDGTTLVEGTDYTAFYVDNVEPGTAMVIITGIGSYAGTNTATFTIAAKDIAAAEVAPIDDVAYTGAAKTPAVDVTYDGTTLVEGVDYTVAYADNVQPGTATATITGIGSYAGTKTVQFKIVSEDSRVDRIAGPYVADTAAAIAAKAFQGETANAVVIARDDDYFDALSGAGLAGALNAPILLTNSNELSASCLSEIRELGASYAVVLGGTSAVSDDVIASLQAAGLTTERIAGDDAYGTSLLVAQRLASMNGANTQYAVAVNPTSFADAVSIGGWAYENHVPILLQTWGDTAADRGYTADALKILQGRQVLVLGGTAAVSDESVAGLNTTRLGGDTIYATSVAIANWEITQGGMSAASVSVASAIESARGVDALAASALAGREGGVVLLAQSNPDYEPAVETATALGFISQHASEIENVHVLGGETANTAAFYDAIRAALGEVTQQ